MLKSSYSLAGAIAAFTSLALTAAADTELYAGPYPEKAGINIDGYVFSAPIAADASTPVIDVTHEDGVFSSMDEGRSIGFKVQHRAECGQNHELSNLSFSFRDQAGQSLPVYETVTPSDTANLSNRVFILQDYVAYDPENAIAHTPFTACNQVIQTRKAEGKPVLNLLRQGFWRKLNPTYETRMRYGCQKQGLGFHDVVFYSKTVDQPLFIHCVGDPDYKKNYAPTSTTTSARSASQSDIGDALDKKAQEREAFKATLRLRAVLGDGSRQQRITNPLPLAGFMSLGEQLTSQDGLRLKDFEIVKRDGVPHYIGLWESGSGSNIFAEPKTSSDFDAYHTSQKNKGYILVDFEAVRMNGNLHYASIWTKDRGVQDIRGGTRHAFGHRADFMEIYNANKADNRFPVDLEVRLRDGKIGYRAVWKRFANGDGPQFMSAVPLEEFRTLRDQLNAAGKIAIDLERIEKGDQVFITGLWADGSGDTAFSRPRSYEAMETFMAGPVGARHIRDLEVHKVN